MNTVRLWGETEPRQVVAEFMVDYPTQAQDVYADDGKEQQPDERRVPVVIQVVR